jgi:hypothetical protein
MTINIMEINYKWLNQEWHWIKKKIDFRSWITWWEFIFFVSCHVTYHMISYMYLFFSSSIEIVCFLFIFKLTMAMHDNLSFIQCHSWFSHYLIPFHYSSPYWKALIVLLGYFVDAVVDRRNLLQHNYYVIQGFTT